MTMLSLDVEDGKLVTKIVQMSKEDALRSFELLKRGCNMEESLAEEIRTGVNEFKVVTWEELGITDSDIDLMIKESKQNRAFRLFEKMKKTVYESSARNDAKEIKELILDGFVTWEELHATDDFFDELIAEAVTQEILEKLEYLRKKCPYYAIEKTTEEIRKAVVERHAITWGRLKIIEAELPEETHQAYLRYFRETLEVVKTAHDKYEAIDYAGCLRKAVKHSLVTWEELKVTEDQLEKLIKEAGIRKAVNLLERLDKNGWCTIDQDADPIRHAVTKGDVTWEDLDTTSEEFEALVHALKVKEYSKLVEQERKEQTEGKFCINYSYIRQIVERGELTFEEIGTSKEEVTAWIENAEKIKQNKK